MSTPATDPNAIYGMLAEFDDAPALLAATEKAYAEGYRHMDAFAPFPVDGLSEALGFHHDNVARYTLIGGILGCIGGYALQYFANVELYPINVGGRPLNSWPAFVPITFETTVLVAALTAVFSMLAENGLPKPYHPVFNSPRFQLATRDRFFLCIETSDPKYDPATTRQFLLSSGALGVEEVRP